MAFFPLLQSLCIHSTMFPVSCDSKSSRIFRTFSSPPRALPVQLCFRILEQEKKVPFDEFNYLLYGGIVVERYYTTQRPRPLM